MTTRRGICAVLAVLVAAGWLLGAPGAAFAVKEREPLKVYQGPPCGSGPQVGKVVIKDLKSGGVKVKVRIVNGKPMVLLSETLLGIPTTAHILGGAVMGRDRSEGVIDSDNRVFGYKDLYICDGSVVSANPGVNPSLTIAALAERAMSMIPSKGQER